MTITVIKPGVRGIDLSRSPFLLGSDFARHAINLQFLSSGIRTRFGTVYDSMGIKGRFQGCNIYRPARGMSTQTFSADVALVVTMADGFIYVNASDNYGIHGQPVKLGGADDACYPQTPIGPVHIYSAENWLIIQGTGRTTVWWDCSTLNVTRSPGMTEEPLSVLADGETSTHDTWEWDKHKNFLLNNSPIGIFAHARVHQEFDGLIYVGDPLHKRGYLKTTDVLLMEEQRLPSFGPPLPLRSALGEVRAMEVTPRMGNSGTAYGQGELVCYCAGGVVAFNTAVPGRRRKVTANGEIATEGWEGKRMVDPLLDKITAVGRYAVTALPRDQFFRSSFGLHILSQVVGVEVFNDEVVHTFSSAVEPILNCDRPDVIGGSATGYWIGGGRFLCTTLMREGCDQSVTPVGGGMVVYNKVFTKTLDGTPLGSWDGLWTPAPGTVNAFIRFLSLGLTPDCRTFGVVTADKDNNLLFGRMSTDLRKDYYGGCEHAIPWMYESGRFRSGDYATMGITCGVIESTLIDLDASFTIDIKSDRCPEWTPWFEVNAEAAQVSPDDVAKNHGLWSSIPTGAPPEGTAEAGWVQFRLRGTGAVELHGFSLEVSTATTKGNETMQRQVPVHDPISLSV